MNRDGLIEPYRGHADSSLQEKIRTKGHDLSPVLTLGQRGTSLLVESAPAPWGLWCLVLSLARRVGVSLSRRPGGFPGPWWSQKYNVASLTLVRAGGQMDNNVSGCCELDMVIEFLK